MYLTRKRKLFGLLFILTLVFSMSFIHLSNSSEFSFADNASKNISLTSEKDAYRIFEIGKIDVNAKADSTDRYFKILVHNNNSKIIDSNELSLSDQLQNLDIIEKEYDSNTDISYFIFKLKKNESVNFKIFTTSKNGMPGEVTAEGFDGATLNDIKINANYSDKVSLSWNNESIYNSDTDDKIITSFEKRIDAASNSIHIGPAEKKSSKTYDIDSVESNNANNEDSNNLIIKSDVNESSNQVNEENSVNSTYLSDSINKEYLENADSKITYDSAVIPEITSLDNTAADNGSDKKNIVSNNTLENTDSNVNKDTSDETNTKNHDADRNIIDKDNSKSDQNKDSVNENTDSSNINVEENKSETNIDEKEAENNSQESEENSDPSEISDDYNYSFSPGDEEKQFFSDYMKYSSSDSDDFSLDVINSYVGLDRSSIEMTPKTRVRRSALNYYFNNNTVNESDDDPIPKHVKSIEKYSRNSDDDTYRLTLDSEGFSKKSVDVLFIVDTSNSMNDNFENDEVAQNPEDSRWSKLYNIVTKNNGLSDTFLDNDSIDVRFGLEFFSGNVDAYKTTKELVSEKLIDGSGNVFQLQVPSVVSILDSPYNDAKKILDFSKISKYNFDRILLEEGNKNIRLKNGTNSQAALHFAVNHMIPTMRDDAKKYVIFLTDGKPDFYYSYYGETARFPIPNTVPKHLRSHMAKKANDPQLENGFIYVNSTPSPAGYSLGGGQFVNKPSVERALYEARNIKNIDGFFAIGLSQDAIGGIDGNYSSLLNGESVQLSSYSNSTASMPFNNDFYKSSIFSDQSNLTYDFMKGLTQVVKNGNPEATVKLYETLNNKDLESAMDDIVSKIYSGMTISDTLSEYVDFYSGLYLYRPSVSFTKNGRNNYDSMYSKYGKDFYNLTYDKYGKKIKMELSNKVGMDTDEKVEIGFYVKPNRNAYQTFGKNLNDRYNGKNVELYPDISSDGIRGFYSNKNDEVTLSYNNDGRKSIPYTEKPVVHIATKSISVEKKWKDSDGNILPSNSIDIPVQIELRAYPKYSENSTFGYYKNERGNYLSFKKTLDKSNGYKFTFENLPAKYYDYRVVELTKLDNFETEYSIDDYKNKATIYNKSTTELPQTGGLGVMFLYIIGTLMIMISVIYLKGNKMID